MNRSDVIELPEYHGGSCTNSRCSGSNKQRVLSLEEVEKVYPVKDKFDWWPLPPQATHVCTVCGFAYEGVSEQAKDEQPPPPVQIEIDLSEWDWEPESQYEQTVREAVESFIRGAPDDATGDEIATGVARYVTGCGVNKARQIMTDMDEFDGTAIKAADYMREQP